MQDVSSGETVVEASPLISFLKVDRVDILEAIYSPLLCTDHVHDEIRWFPQRERLEALLTAGRLREVSFSDPEDLAEFARLTEEIPIGRGEASSLIYAARYGCRLVITDKRGIREAERRGVVCVAVHGVMVHAIQARAISLADADALITAWADQGEFPVNNVTSFAPYIIP